MKNTKPNRDITADLIEKMRSRKTFRGVGLSDTQIEYVESRLILALTKQKEEIVKYVRDEVIGEDEWEDPDIEGSDQSNGDMVVKPWRRNGLRAEQRRKLNELK